MRTTSQSEEEISEHAAHQPSGKSEHTIRPGIASPEAARGTWRANEIFKRARSLTRPIIGGLFFGALGALAISLISHFAVVVPLERNLLSAEVRGLATDIDAAVRMRSSIISMVAGNSELDGFLETGGLDNLLSALRMHFPDFLSVEATNDRGQIQAMGGELPLPQGGLFSKDPSEKTSTLNLGIQHNRGAFHDDPENNCFFITCKHVGAEGGKWFTRSRFSRESVAPILKANSTRGVNLVPVSGVSKDILEGPISLSRPELSVVRTFGSWWSGPIGAEALLTMPGWLIRIENSQTPLLLWRLPIAASLLLLLLTFAAGFIIRQAPVHVSCGQVAAEEHAGNQIPAQDEKPATQFEPSKESDSLSEHTSERFSPLEKDHALLQQEPEFEKPTTMRECGSNHRDDLPCLTKLVPIPGGNSPIEVTGCLGQEPRAGNSGERGPLPETLEVCWFEPCDHCETDQPLSEEKSECARLSDEEEGFGGERSPKNGHPLSITG
jgi:hypothetical protein